MKIRYATEADTRGMFPDGAAPTLRAVVVEDAGKVVAIGGYIRAIDHLQAFSHVSQEMRPHKITLGRVAVKVKSMLDELPKVWALCDPSEPTAPGLLAWCGFEHVHDGVWLKKGGA